jgi:hypothetical protein
MPGFTSKQLLRPGRETARSDQMNLAEQYCFTRILPRNTQAGTYPADSPSFVADS